MEAVAARYIGVPFVAHGRGADGLDCWGLVCRLYQEHFGLTLPSYAADYRSVADGDEIAAIVRQEVSAWCEVPPAAVQPGDVLVWRIKGLRWHVGVALAAPWFVHADLAAGVVRERWDAAVWQSRLAGVYRHRTRAGGGRS